MHFEEERVFRRKKRSKLVRAVKASRVESFAVVGRLLAPMWAFEGE